MMRVWDLIRIAACGLMMLSVAVPAKAFDPPVCRNAFTQQQEITEGQKVAAQVYQQMPVLKDSDPVAVYVRQLGAKLAGQAPGYEWPYNFHVVSSGDINAFALPGGSIFINLATVQVAESEAQLAGVMAHEISHVVMRHSTCNITKQQKAGLWYGLAQLGAGVVLGGDSALGGAAQQAIGMGAGLHFLRMGRDAERQADLLGTDILYSAGYDPRGMPQFFEIIQGKYGSGGSQFLSDHPNPGNRTEYVNAEIAKLPPRQKNTKTTAEFDRIHFLAAQRKPLTGKEIQAGAWKASGDFQMKP